MQNKQVERLWRDVYSGVLCYYYNLFSFMEDESSLDPLDPLHMFVLHYVYMHKINEKLFCLRTVRTSPRRLWTSGILSTQVNPSPLNTGESGSYLSSVDLSRNDSRPILESYHINVDERCTQLLQFHCPKNWWCSN